MEVRRPPYVRRLALVVAAVLSLSYGWQTFSAAGADQCWALPFGPRTICDARIAGFVIAVTAVLTAMGTLFVALAGLPLEETVRSRLATTRAPIPPPEPSAVEDDILDSRRLDEILKRATAETTSSFGSDFTVDLNGQKFHATSLEGLREELRKRSGYDAEQIEEILRMFGQHFGKFK